MSRIKNTNQKTKQAKRAARDAKRAQGILPMPKLTEEQGAALLRAAQRSSIELAIEQFSQGQPIFAAMGGAVISAKDFHSIVETRVEALHAGAMPTAYTLEHGLCATELSSVVMPSPTAPGYDIKVHESALDTLRTLYGGLEDPLTGEQVTDQVLYDTWTSMLQLVPGPHLMVDGKASWVLYAMPTSGGFSGYMVVTSEETQTADSLVLAAHNLDNEIHYILNATILRSLMPNEPETESTDTNTEEENV